MPAVPLMRRSFLRSSAVLLAGSMVRTAAAGELPDVSDPRATDGDDRHQPGWDQRMTITVGHDHADLNGRDDKVIQAAVDYVSRFGGGTVKILPGIFTLRNAIHLRSGIRVIGSGAESVITKIASETVSLSSESDWYDQEITLADRMGFRVGDGVLLRAKNPHNGGEQVIKRTLVAQSGNRYKLSDGIRKNLWLSGNPTCSSLFPLFTSENASDVLIENITFDGNKANNTNLNGNYGGCIFLQDCNRFTIRNVETRDYDGDGISFQVCHDIVVDGCHSHDNTNLGVHPGSGSQRPLIRDSRLERNKLGLFWCWGVKYGLAENNKIDANSSYGVSIGHNDTDNVMRNNDITRSGKFGILFRDEARGKNFWPHRNTVTDNRIVDSGDDAGIAIDIQGKTTQTVIANNEIRETRGPASRIGIRIGADVGQVKLSGNTISGLSREVVDARAS